MPANQFENSRISEGTLHQNAQHNGTVQEESRAISRDDVRDGFAEASPAREGNTPTTARPRIRRVLAASTLTGDRVRNPAGEELGKIDEIMVDLGSGRIAYVVLSFGGFLGIGDKLFAVPWSAFRVDQGEHEFILDIDSETLRNAPGFDKGDWPDMSDPSFGMEVHKHYGKTPYWEHTVTDTGDFTGEERVPDRSREFESTTGYQRRH
ncbi:MAG TPA: PRC-barrel domain-containing protein [Bryobacteraceae bacterium]|jgi:sporulation protein YlmC with PRC-barrel domain|nr:PRC-barrel domain-containing protein [Bryobacteraceae bacterium]